MSDMDEKQPVPLDYFLSHHMPQASWMVGGAFRFDVHLLTLLSYLSSYFPPRRVARVVGAPPCAWSLDMVGARAPMTPQACINILASYAQDKVGVVLLFDNPQVSKESLEDAFAHWLIQELLKKSNNPTGRNAVCVADDVLAQALRSRYSKLNILCHVNRHVLTNDKRTPEYYIKLTELYQQIMLHPRDAVQKQLITRLKYPERYIAVLNDLVPRRYPTRRELVTLAAQMRRNPYDYTIAESMRRLQQRTGYYTDEDTCNLTECEERALYEAGVRHYAIQAQMIRNEITLWWDMFYHMLRTTPEHTNKAALVMSAAMASIRENPNRVPGGLGLFSLTNELD